jgi:hypothetical protein
VRPSNRRTPYYAGPERADQAAPLRGARNFRAESVLGNTYRVADSLEKLEERARSYWRAELSEWAEVLIEGATVIERILQ